MSFVLIGGTDRSALHDPRSCLIGAGMQAGRMIIWKTLPGTAIQAVRSCHAISGLNSSASDSGSGGSDLLYLYVS